MYLQALWNWKLSLDLVHDVLLIKYKYLSKTRWVFVSISIELTIKSVLYIFIHRCCLLTIWKFGSSLLCKKKMIFIWFFSGWFKMKINKRWLSLSRYVTSQQQMAACLWEAWELSQPTVSAWRQSWSRSTRLVTDQTDKQCQTFFDCLFSGNQKN